MTIASRQLSSRLSAKANHHFRSVDIEENYVKLFYTPTSSSIKIEISGEYVII